MAGLARHYTEAVAIGALISVADASVAQLDRARAF